MGKCCDSYCIGCCYLEHSLFSCTYIFEEGHPRGCPPGNGCTKRSKKNKYNGRIILAPGKYIQEKPVSKSELSPAAVRKALRMKEKAAKEKAIREKRQELYNQGMSDQQIAEATGQSKYAVTQWRQNMGIPANAGRNCATCGKPLVGRTSKTMYCCPACASKAYYEKKLEKEGKLNEHSGNQGEDV